MSKPSIFSVLSLPSEHNNEEMNEDPSQKQLLAASMSFLDMPASEEA